MMEGIKRGILRGFLELDEKLRKIPEVSKRAMMLCPNSLPSFLNYENPNNCNATNLVKSEGPKDLQLSQWDSSFESLTVLSNFFNFEIQTH